LIAGIRSLIDGQSHSGTTRGRTLAAPRLMTLSATSASSVVNSAARTGGWPRRPCRRDRSITGDDQVRQRLCRRCRQLPVPGQRGGSAGVARRARRGAVFSPVMHHCPRTCGWLRCERCGGCFGPAAHYSWTRLDSPALVSAGGCLRACTVSIGWPGWGPKSSASGSSLSPR
jgi:hypothetical protein